MDQCTAVPQEDRSAVRRPYSLNDASVFVDNCRKVARLDLGGIRVGPPNETFSVRAAAVNQDLQGLADPLAVVVVQDSLLERHQLRPPGLRNLGIHLRRQVMGRGAFFPGKGEHPQALEAVVLHEPAELQEVLVGLPGKPRDQRGADGNARHLLP